MLKNRHFISYFITTLIYTLSIGLFFYAQNHFLVSFEKSEEKTTELCLCSFQPESVTPVEPVEKEQTEEVKEPEKTIAEEEAVIEEEPAVEPEVTKAPTPEKKPEIKEEVVPEKVTQKVVPKPVVKKAKKKPEAKKKRKKKRVKKKTTQKKRTRKKAASRSVKSSPAQKNKFLANIRAKINQHKSYPRIAKRRGMQGTVKVNFTILSNGNVGNISVSGPKVFHRSARNAVKSAFPVNVKNAPISLPKSINLTLLYKIR